MTVRLTEIGNASQFHEYLSVLGIHKPPMESIHDAWEFSQRDEVVARVQIQRDGSARFFLNVHRLCQHH